MTSKPDVTGTELAVKTDNLRDTADYIGEEFPNTAQELRDIADWLETREGAVRLELAQLRRRTVAKLTEMVVRLAYGLVDPAMRERIDARQLAKWNDDWPVLAAVADGEELPDGG